MSISWSAVLLAFNYHLQSSYDWYVHWRCDCSRRASGLRCSAFFAFCVKSFDRPKSLFQQSCEPEHRIMPNTIKYSEWQCILTAASLHTSQIYQVAANICECKSDERYNPCVGHYTRRNPMHVSLRAWNVSTSLIRLFATRAFPLVLSWNWKMLAAWNRSRRVLKPIKRWFRSLWACHRLLKSAVVLDTKQKISNNKVLLTAGNTQLEHITDLALWICLATAFTSVCRPLCQSTDVFEHRRNGCSWLSRDYFWTECKHGLNDLNLAAIAPPDV